MNQDELFKEAVEITGKDIIQVAVKYELSQLLKDPNFREAMATMWQRGCMYAVQLIEEVKG